MAGFKSLLVKLFGDKDQIESERYFITLTFFYVSLFLVLLSGVHIIMNLAPELIYLSSSSAVILLLLYFWVRSGRSLFYPKLIITVLGLLLLDVTWYVKFLSLGPVLLFIFAFGALIIWVWQGRALVYLLIFYLLNTVALFLIEYQKVDFAIEYTNLQTRSVDIYLSFFLYSSLMIFLLSKVKGDFMKQKERAVRSDKLKSAFLANMSHEIRTPMNGIVGFSELLVKEKDEDKQQQYLEIIQNSGTSLLRLVNEILDLSKIEAGDVEVNNSSFSVKDVLNEIKDLYSIELIKKERVDVKLNYYLPDGDFVIYSDKYRIKQTLSNLLSNAIKFTVQGSIVISCRKKDNELVFSVSDTGTGIPEEDQPKIYERFTKFDYDGLNTEGSGIGLSIVKKTTEILNGRIWLKSEPGLGSTFFVAIPFVSRRKTSAEEENKTFSGEMPDSKKTILVVEDDKTSFLLIKEILRPMEFDIHHVTDGNDAVEFMKNNPYTNLILMDIKLPFMDGYKATTAIKKMNSKITIIAQTAYAMLGDREKAISAGCDDYLTKPIDPNKLLELIKAHIK